MIVLVTGGRDYKDRDFLFETMSRLEKESGTVFRGLIHGACPTGADKFADEWQHDRIMRMDALLKVRRKTDPHRQIRTVIRNNQLWTLAFPAKWDDLVTLPVVLRYRNGKPYNAAAGGIRNQQMADFGPQLCIAFPGGSGTADMVRRAHAAHIRVIEVGGEGELFR